MITGQAEFNGLQFHFVCVDEGNDRSPSHWRVTVKNKNHKFVAPYQQGAADRVIRKRAFSGSQPKLPDPKNVLWCLFSDAMTAADAACFEEWADELGYNSDSITHKKTYEACQQIHYNLRQLRVDFEQLSELYEDY